MHWFESLENPQAVSSLFTEIDALSMVDLHEVVAHRDGPVVRIRFDVQPVPRTLPKSWPTDANTTQITLAAWGAEELLLNGWGTSNLGRLSVEREGTAQVLNFVGGPCKFKARHSLLRVERIQGYVKQRDG